METADNQLWVGNGIGLWRLNRTNGQLERIVPEKIDFAVNTLLPDGDILYIGYGERAIHPKGWAIAPSIDRPEYAGCL